MKLYIPSPGDQPKKSTAKTSADPLFNPFTILVDTAEQQPYLFTGLHADADRKSRALVVAPGINLFRANLGRYPNSLGDYTLAEFMGRCHIERKSQEDAYGTILGFSKIVEGQAIGDTERRKRFESELVNLSNIEAGCVIVECSEGRLYDEAPEYDLGKKTAALNRKILHRSLIAWRQDYPAKWIFCDTRRLAEETAFRFLERFFDKHRTKRQSNASK